jgi:hypothetical protein
VLGLRRFLEVYEVGLDPQQIALAGLLEVGGDGDVLETGAVFMTDLGVECAPSSLLINI